jgi:hypothetical protein
MQIIGAIQTNINIFTDPGQRIKIESAERSNQSAVTKAPFSSMDAGIAELSRMTRENNIKFMNLEREAFYLMSSSLQSYNPGQHGQLSVEDEIRLATETGFAAIIDGKLTPSFSLTWTNDPNSILDVTTNSPLDFMQKIDNLRSLFEHLGDSALNYSSQFESALKGIIDDIISAGGRYVSADKEGVADSIQAMFNGDEGKYSADDLKTMMALSFESMINTFPPGASEHTLGAMLGYNAVMIEMARSAGRLSDAAYATVKTAFNTHVDDLIKQMDEYLDWQKNDPWSPKDVTYSPAHPEIVKEAIELMIKTLDGSDFNQSLRTTLRLLEGKHNAQRENQLSNGALDQRYNTLFFITVNERTSFSDAAQISSRFFSEFLNKPEWTINSGLFSVNVTV